MSIESLLQQGVQAFGRSDFVQALNCFDEVLAAKPDHLYALNSRGTVLFQLGRNDEALACFDRMLSIEPGHVHALNNRHGLLMRLGRHEEASTCLARVAAVDADQTETICNEGRVHGNLGRHAEAAACFDRVLAIQPRHIEALVRRGSSLIALGRYEQALQSLDRALALEPNHVLAFHERGVALGWLHRHHEALADFDRSLSLAPSLEALINRGGMLSNLGRYEEALQCYDRALALQPGHAEARNGRSFVLLGRGELAEGFREQEVRWETAFFKSSRLNTPAPTWLGQQPLPGKTLLLHAEQGLGDTIQFSRYALLAAQRGARVILRVPPSLHRLMQTLPGPALCISEREPLPPHDLHCPLLSLPLAFGTTLGTIPAEVSYLRADPALAEEWKQRLGAGGRPRVGLAWAGRQQPPINHVRDIRLELLLPLLETGAQFVSLQKEIPPGDQALLSDLTGLARHGEAVGDMADTAALIANLDLVIAVDSAVAHLAAALGKPVWIMNRYASCWRWLRGRSDSPWYPTVKLFRQPSYGDWNSVVEAVCKAAVQFVAEKARHAAGQPDAAPPAVPSLMRDGMAAFARSDYPAALACFAAILDVEPRHMEALIHGGVTLGIIERYDEAAACFDRILKIDPGHMGAIDCRGRALAKLGRYAEALDCFDRIVATNPRHIDALWSRGLCLEALQRHAEALDCFRKILNLAPGHGAALNSCGVALSNLQRQEEALSCFEQALTLNPRFADAWVNKGSVLFELNRDGEALACYERALALDPQHALAQAHRSFLYLANGDLQRGFRDFEARWQTAQLQSARPKTPAPLWLGREPLQGKTIVVLHELGLGDTLQFSRYAGLVARRGARVILRVPASLSSLMKTLPGAGELSVIGDSEPIPPHDYHCPLLSLPLALGTTLETIPADIPYLRADPARVSAWSARLGRATRPRIGLVWSGRQYPPINHARDMRLESLRPLLDLDLEFISLQKDIPLQDRALLDTLPQLIRHGESLADFTDTAALVANLDLVITVDTSVAHLAGALGKPVWIMNRYASCWRWLRGRSDSPWYPSARLFRQRAHGDWGGVVAEVGEGLRRI